MSKNNYTSKDIRVMEEIEHLQHNPGMYIGSTETPIHLLSESLDNALDEASAGHANLIGVSINEKDGVCIVSDNGRGIPIDNDVISTIATKLFSGGKFAKGGDTSAYGIAAGLHGIGLVAVTALSEWVEIIVYRDGKKAVYSFKDSKLDKKKITKHTEDKPFSTQISFKPNSKYFEQIKFDINFIRRRLKLASIHIPDLKLILLNGDDKEVINCDINDFFKDTLLGGKSKDVTPIFQLKNKIKDEEVHIKFAWDLTNTNVQHHGCINLLSVDMGSHINRTHILFKNVFEAVSKKEKFTFQPNDCLVGLRCLTNLFLYQPKYTSQTKEKLSNSKAEIEHMYAGLEAKLIETLNKYPQVRDQLLGRFEHYRKGLSANKSIIRGGAKVSRFNQVIDSKLKDCTTHTVEKSELFITEGSSAAGSLIQCRNPKYHAILGLKGKIPNLAASGKNFLKNKEVIEIINSLGTGIDPHFSGKSLRYGKIIFACDADSDGAHITTLLMVLFLKLVPELIKDGSKIYRAIMPLYGTMEGKKFVPFYNDEELTKYKEKHPKVKIQRYKGLGEMNPNQLKVCLLDPKRRIEEIGYPEDIEAIWKIMTSAEQKRTLL